MNEAIYLDYQSTTPLAPEALGAMLPWLESGHWNPHSGHAGGRRAAAAVEVAREEIISLLPSGGRLIFTSGATEALNWAIQRSGAGGIVTVATEHAAVLDVAEGQRAGGRPVSVLPVLADGLIDADTLDHAVMPGTALVAVMQVNNEIGVKQPVEFIAMRATEVGALMLCDSVQGYGRLTIPDCCDLIAISAHKIHGPKGIGALWIRNGVNIGPWMLGGGQEAGLRSGTLSPALCAGFGAAARLARERMDADAEHIQRLWDCARTLLGDWTINGNVDHRYRGNLNVRRAGVDVARLMSDVRDVAFSVGSACASGSGRPSHVLRALGLSDAEARSSIRLGFGRYTSIDDIERGVGAINAAAERQLEA